MGANFDELLKKAKKNVSPSSSDEDIWRECINVIMHATHKLNGLFPGKLKQKHNIRLEQGACKTCGVPMYVLAVRQLNDPTKVLRFHKGGWKYVGENKYYCDQCRKA